MITVWENEATPGSVGALTRGLTHLLDTSERGLAVKATSTCTHPDGCARAHFGKGWCQAHYMRVWATGDPGPAEIRPARRPAVCSVADCGRKHDGHGLCSMHLKRRNRDGDLDRGRPSGDLHHRWAGDAPSYTAAHARVSRERGPAAEWCCARCSCPADDWAYDHADPNELTAPNPRNGVPMRYSADPSHYMPLCKSDHVRFDQTRKAAA